MREDGVWCEGDGCYDCCLSAGDLDEEREQYEGGSGSDGEESEGSDESTDEGSEAEEEEEERDIIEVDATPAREKWDCESILRCLGMW